MDTWLSFAVWDPVVHTWDLAEAVGQPTVVLTAGFLALGMLVGSRIGTGFGLDYEPDTSATPLALSVCAAAIGVFEIAVAWAMPRQLLAPTIVISSISWLSIAIVDRSGDGAGWAAYCLAAGVVGALGTLAAAAQGTSASIYTGVAILPLVPGFQLYTGMLAVAQYSDAAGAILSEVATTSIAIAIGVAVGLSVTRNALEVGRHVRTSL